ncbi:MAG: PAS domain-containing protein [Planctomycetota bacterium]|nr:PAS domain-containing protein [Planctomycetota bacterium]
MGLSAGVLLGLTGGSIFVAWLAGVMAARGLSGITVKCNASIALLLSGSALTLLALPRPTLSRVWVARGCAMVVLLLGAFTLAENLFDLDLGIDQLLAKESPGAKGFLYPNRMGVPGSLAFALAGAASLLLSHRDRRVTHWAQGLALGVGLIGLLPTVGYLYGVPGLYGIARYTAIAWPMAVSLLVLALGLLCVRPTQGFMALVTADDPSGQIFRGMILPVLLVPLALGWLAGPSAGYFELEMGTALRTLATMVVMTGLLYYAGHRIGRSSATARRAGESLSASEERFRRLVEVSSQIVWVSDAQGRMVEDSASWRAFTGRGLEEWLGDHWLEGVHPEDRHRVADAWQCAVATVAPYHVELRQRRRDGVYRVMACQAVPIRNPNGGVREWVGMNIDITDRKRAEAALKESEGHARRIIDHTLAFVGVLSPDGTLQEVNAAALQASGVKREDVVGRKFWDCHWWCYDPQVQEQLRQAVARAAKGEVVRNDATARLAPDGWMLVDFMLAPVHNEAGEVTHLIPSALDITERKRAEEDLRRLPSRRWPQRPPAGWARPQCLLDREGGRTARGRGPAGHQGRPQGEEAPRADHQDRQPRRRRPRA